VITFGPPELVAEMLPPLLRGDEVWCQGFSEPDTGSNLGSLACRAVRDGDVWRVTGQKVWTSLSQYAQRCVLLTRTGTVESAHRGITALFVDMDTPGITIRPIETMDGEDEFSEVFFDDVPVPVARTLGQPDQGWAFAMDLLPYERSTSLWQRAAWLHRRLGDLVAAAGPGALDPAALGEVTQLVYAFRARSRATQHRMAAGGTLGAETSVDKVLLATAEQALFDLAAEALPGEVLVGDDVGSERWRGELLYSRAASIYGGSAEIQRNIIARRLLELGDDR
jgi:alkylation response protein AidB-like acyl-CoA dehydrogenase